MDLLQTFHLENVGDKVRASAFAFHTSAYVYVTTID